MGEKTCLAKIWLGIASSITEKILGPTEGAPYTKNESKLYWLGKELCWDDKIF